MQHTPDDMLDRYATNTKLCLSSSAISVDHPDRAVGGAIPPEPPVVAFFDAGTARSAQGRAWFWRGLRTLAREHRSGIPMQATGGPGGWNPILLVSSELFLFAQAAACLIISFLCSLRYSMFRYLVASIQFSCISTASARISRRHAAVLGKIRTTSVRRLISSLSRSSRFVDFRFLWCCRGKR